MTNQQMLLICAVLLCINASLNKHNIFLYSLWAVCAIVFFILGAISGKP
jgi:hypothetical protein